MVVVVDELVELHATAATATTVTMASAAMRVFNDAEPKASPFVLGLGHVGRDLVPGNMTEI